MAMNRLPSALLIVILAGCNPIFLATTFLVLDELEVGQKETEDFVLINEPAESGARQSGLGPMPVK